MLLALGILSSIENYNTIFYVLVNLVHVLGRRGRDRMVVGFTTTYTMIAYHH